MTLNSEKALGQNNGALLVVLIQYGCNSILKNYSFIVLGPLVLDPNKSLDAAAITRIPGLGQRTQAPRRVWLYKQHC